MQIDLDFELIKYVFDVLTRLCFSERLLFDEINLVIQLMQLFEKLTLSDSCFKDMTERRKGRSKSK